MAVYSLMQFCYFRSQWRLLPLERADKTQVRQGSTKLIDWSGASSVSTLWSVLSYPTSLLRRMQCSLDSTGNHDFTVKTNKYNKVLEYLEKKTPNCTSLIDKGQHLKRPFEFVPQHYPAKRPCVINNNPLLTTPFPSLQPKHFIRPAGLGWLNQFRPYEPTSPTLISNPGTKCIKSAVVSWLSLL